MAELLQTTLCYLEHNGCYLMLHRVKKKKDVNHDKWIGVGGKFEPGEDARACVQREVREETGLELEQAEYRGMVDFFLRALACREDAPVHQPGVFRHYDGLQ